MGIKIALAFTLLAVVVFGGCACRRRFERARKKYGNLWRDVLRILTINVSFLQINASLPSVLSGMEFSFPQAYLDFLEEFNFVNLDVLSFFGVPCVAANIDFRVSVAAAGCVPISVAALAGPASGKATVPSDSSRPCPAAVPAPGGSSQPRRPPHGADPQPW